MNLLNGYKPKILSSMKVYLDIETGGIDPEKHGLIQIGMVTKESGFFKSDIIKDYGKGYSDEAFRAHGIPTADIIESTHTLRSQLHKMSLYIALIRSRDLYQPLEIWCWNDTFERRFIEWAFAYCDMVIPDDWSFNCVMRMDAKYRGARNRALGDACQAYKITYGNHDCLRDAVSTMFVHMHLENLTFMQRHQHYFSQ